jgi:tetratricopeptide (TPR) repeat protein
MDKTADMFEKIVRYGPYGELGPPSQMNIGAAREKEKDYPLAVKAYELAADRYSEQPAVAVEALYKAALAYNKQARKADYDQSVAGQAISAFTDFMALFPNDPRVADAQRIIGQLKRWRRRAISKWRSITRSTSSGRRAGVLQRGADQEPQFAAGQRGAPTHRSPQQAHARPPPPASHK